MLRLLLIVLIFVRESYVALSLFSMGISLRYFKEAAITDTHI